MRWHWWALLGAVLLAHALGLVGVHRLAMGIGGVQAMDEPLFTRMLAPTAPAALAAAAMPAALPQAVVLKEKLLSALDSVASDATETIANSITSSSATLAKLEPLQASTSLPELATRSLSEVAAVALDTLGLRGTATAAAAASPTFAAALVLPSVGGGSGTASIDTWPTDTRLNYKVTGDYRGPISGKANVSWQRQGERYQVRLALNLGLIDVTMLSQGKVYPTTLWPQVYEEVLSKPRRLRLDDQALAFVDGNTLARPPGVQDTVSQFVEITQRFATGRAELREGAVVHIPLARPGGFNDWYYDVDLEPKLPTRLNDQYREFAAWHLTPRPVVNARGPIRMEFWLVPELQFFPAKVRITLDKDAYLDLEVDSILQR